MKSGPCVRRQSENVAAAADKDRPLSIITAAPRHRGVTMSFFQ